MSGGFARRAAGAALALGLAAAGARAQALVGGEFVYTVAAGDTLTSIGARFGTPTGTLARDNALAPGERLRPGRTLAVVNRHIAPDELADGIVVNVPQRMLWLFRERAPELAFPVAAGRPDWRTPLGEFTVVNRQTDKTWIVPASIQEEMRREGKPVVARVAPGPDNPLGRHWIGLSIDSVGIHGTNAPASVYGLRSHGCLRVHPDDVARLYERVAVGTPGAIVYRPALLASDAQGRIWAEVHPDAYRRAPPPAQALKDAAQRAGLSERVDWGKVADVVRGREGLAREVGVDRPEPPAGAVPKAP